MSTDYENQSLIKSTLTTTQNPRWPPKFVDLPDYYYIGKSYTIFHSIHQLGHYLYLQCVQANRRTQFLYSFSHVVEKMAFFMAKMAKS